jgi:rhodanese-related sulfurtransferase
MKTINNTNSCNQQHIIDAEFEHFFERGANSVAIPHQTVSAEDQLKQLGEQFRTAYAALGQTANRALAEALACGKILIEAKKAAGHGGWMKWLAEHGKISIKCAQRYMKLVKNSASVTNLNQKSLTECYTDLGMLKEKQTRTANGSSPKQKPSDTLQVKGMVLRISGLLIKTTDAEKMAKELEPIIAWHNDYIQQKEKQKAAALLNEEYSIAA